MADIADNPSQTDARDILSKHVSESTLYIIKKLRGSGSGARKRKRSSSPKTRKQKNKRARITKRKASSKTIKRDIPVIRISHYPIMSGDVVFVTSEFDIFEQKPIQTAILETHVVHHKPFATVDQNDLDFLIPGDTETYIDPDNELYVRGKIVGADGKDLAAPDFTAGTNNFLHSLFSECSVSLNGVNITPASELYPYRAYLESLMTYGSDAAISHLTTAYWYLDEGDVLAGDPTSDIFKNEGHAKRWNLQKQSKVTELYGRLHTDICNLSQFLLSGVHMQIRLTKAKEDFYLMNAKPIRKQKRLLNFWTPS